MHSIDIYNAQRFGVAHTQSSENHFVMGKVHSDKDTALAFVYRMEYKAYLYSSIFFLYKIQKMNLIKVH